MNPGNVKHRNHSLAFTHLGMSLRVRGIKAPTGGGLLLDFLGRSLCLLYMAVIPLRSGIPRSPRGWRCETEREKSPWGATTEQLNKSLFNPGIKLGEQQRPAEGKLQQLLWGAIWKESVNPTKLHQVHNSSSSPSLPFLPPTMFLKRVPGLGEQRSPTPLKCCLLQTVQRISVINSLSQDSYFWSGLWGGNLLESSSFILRFTVLPFPAERGEKWNHMFGGASVGNPTEDKWLLLSPGN